MSLQFRIKSVSLPEVLVAVPKRLFPVVFAPALKPVFSPPKRPPVAVDAVLRPKDPKPVSQRAKQDSMTVHKDIINVK